MKKILTILALITLLVGCYKSELTNTTHPDTGKVQLTINLDLSADSDATTPEGYTVILNGEEFAVGKDGFIELPETLDPGIYTLYVYSNTDEMNIANNISELGEGTITSSKIINEDMVESLTKDLYYGKQTITVLADQVIASEITLSQVTRTIKFNLQITEGDPDRIASVSATLGGISGQWECVDDITVGDAVSIAPEFAQGESLSKSAEANDYLTSSIKVLGINGDKQDLVLTLTYTDDKTQEITSPLGAVLTGTNDTKSTPITLSGELNTPIEGSMEGATIDNWTKIEGGSITVN